MSEIETLRWQNKQLRLENELLQEQRYKWLVTGGRDHEYRTRESLYDHDCVLCGYPERSHQPWKLSPEGQM